MSAGWLPAETVAEVSGLGKPREQRRHDMNRYRKFEHKEKSWRGPFVFTFGNFQIEIYIDEYKGWVSDKACFSRVVGFAGLAIHIVPDLAAYLDNE